MPISLTGGTGGWTEGLQVGGKRFQNSGLDSEECELPFSANIDETAGLEFLDVVGKRGGRDGKGLAGHGTAQWAVGAGDLLKQLEAPGIRQRLENCRALGAGEAQRPSRFRNIDGRSNFFFHSHGV